MTKRGWKKKIIEACETVGTYKESFDSVVDTLASILERRDEAEELYKSSGSKILVKHVNKGGAANIEQNPVLRLINDLNRDALTYWKEMGLTPAGLKRLNDMALKPEKKENSLAEAIRELGG